MNDTVFGDGSACRFVAASGLHWHAEVRPGVFLADADTRQRIAYPTAQAAAAGLSAAGYARGGVVANAAEAA